MKAGEFMETDIVCVGQLVVDVLVKPVDSLDYKTDTCKVDSFTLKNGGDAMNTAIGLAKLGNRVRFIGKVGTDAFGAYLKDVFREYGVDILGVKEVPDCNTSACLVMINSQAERAFFYHGGANETISTEDIDYDLLVGAKAVHVGGTYMHPKFDGSGAAELFRQARARGCLTSMDVTWDTTGRWMEVIKPCLPYLDFFMPSHKEARQITGTDEPRVMAEILKACGVSNIVIKLGAEGCYVDAGGEAFMQPAFDVNVVDTTGAGDAFVAGFLTGLVKGWPYRRCASFACAVSAHCITRIGSTTGISSFDKTIEFMNDGKMRQ